MADRYIDKKIQILELICKDDFKYDGVSNYGLNITDDELTDIVKEFQWSNLLTVSQLQLINDIGNDGYRDFMGIKEEVEISNEKNDICINYQINDKGKLAQLLKKLKEDYPKRDEPVIREQTLEKIARHFGEMTTATNIISLLKKWGASASLIKYPETKWKIVFNVLNYYAVSKKTEDYNILMNIIEEIVHPLLYEGNFEESKKVVDSFNALLYFDNFDLRFSADSKKYKLSYEPTEQELDEVNEQMWEEFCQQQEEQRKNDKQFYEKAENKERIEILRKYYQTFINIIEVFCQNPAKPSHELNDAYLKTQAILRDIAHKLRSSDNKPLELQSLLESIYFPFHSSNLFGAESIFNRNNQQLSWESIRPKMNYSYGEIDDIFRKINGSDIISEASIQQTLNDVSLLLSKTKEENEAQKIKSQNTQQLVPMHIKKEPIEIKIVSGSKIEIENEKKISKYKFPYKLPAGTKWKNIILQFEDDENIHIQAKQHKHYTNYKDMGFLGKGKNPKPSEAWNFLRVLSKKNGEISIQDTGAKDKYKHQKQKLSEMLEDYFSIDTDPFHPYEENKSYRIKITLIPPHTSSLNIPEPNKEIEDDLGLDEYYKEQARGV